MLEMTAPSDREVFFTRDFNAPPDLVFDAWTKPELLKQWLYGPDDWFMAECKVDLKIGGSYRFVWGHKDGQRMAMGGTYKEIARPHRLVTTELFDEDWTGGETLVTLRISEKPDGGAHTEMTVLYSSKEARDNAMKTGMADGMEMGFARLDVIFDADKKGEAAIG
jgi:uncharacterized protein YndB with AHSA1/START domain